MVLSSPPWKAREWFARGHPLTRLQKSKEILLDYGSWRVLFLFSCKEHSKRKIPNCVHAVKEPWTSTTKIVRQAYVSILHTSTTSTLEVSAHCTKIIARRLKVHMKARAWPTVLILKLSSLSTTIQMWNSLPLRCLQFISKFDKDLSASLTLLHLRVFPTLVCSFFCGYYFTSSNARYKRI